MERKRTNMLGAVMVALLLATPGALADFACDSGTLSSTCVVSTAQVITAPITGADLTIESGGSLTCDTPLCEASIALTGTLVVAGTIKAGNVHVSAADITVSGTVSADYLGYPAARGPGAGHNATVHSCDSRFSGSGGAHGGNGGTANSKTAYSGCDISPSFNAVGGDGYGDLYEPTTPGSGGQHAWHYGTSGDDVIHAQGGAGGGAEHARAPVLRRHAGVSGGGPEAAPRDGAQLRGDADSEPASDPFAGRA